MNGLLKYLLGLVSGIIITVIYFYATGDSGQTGTEQTGEPDVVTTTETAGKNVKTEDIIEIGVPENYIQLYRGMSREEVLEILGKPKNTSLNTILGDVTEHWNYGPYFEGTNVLNLEFVNKKLLNVTQF